MVSIPSFVHQGRRIRRALPGDPRQAAAGGGARGRQRRPRPKAARPRVLAAERRRPAERRPRFVDLAHARGILIDAWTANDPRTVSELFAWGVDTVETDDPEMAVPLRDQARARGGSA